MKTPILASTLTAALVFAAGAYDIKTRDGRVYKEIRLREKTPLGIRFAHEGGVAFLDYSQIPVPDLWTFGYVEADYNAAKNPAPSPSLSGRPTRLYQPTTPTPEREIQLERAMDEAARAESSYVDRPPVGTTTLLSRPARPAGSSSGGAVVPSRAYNGGSTSGGSSISGAARSQCAATTQKGYRCSRLAGAGSSYCWQHP